MKKCPECGESAFTIFIEEVTPFWAIYENEKFDEWEREGGGDEYVAVVRIECCECGKVVFESKRVVGRFGEDPQIKAVVDKILEEAIK